MSTVFPKGSEWRKWDLHVHSPLSILNNQFPKRSSGEPDWEPFLRELESIDAVVIAITDYFTVEGYKALQEFKTRRRIPNVHILPNIEFRLKNIVSARNGDEKRLNLHVIFSEDVPIQDLEEHFLHDIPFYYEGDPQNRDEQRKLKPSNLEELGNKLIEEHKHFREMKHSPLQIGAMQAVVDHEDITSLLTNDSRFKGKYIVALAAHEWDRINWDGQAHHLRKSLLQKSDMVFSSNTNTQQWCLGKSPYEGGVENFIKEFKTLKPCIHGSDAHRIEHIGKPCAKRGEKNHDCGEGAACELRFCWIKADPTFEGFKQLLYEPEDRVAIQQNNPTPVISNYTITGVRVGGGVVNEELSLADANLGLNPFLVAVVGGKGAGKTALVDLVANCYMDREAADDKNSFVKRVAEYKPEISTSLSFRDGAKFSKTLREKKFYEDGQVIYIAQGELEQYIGEKSDLHQRIKDLIFDSPEVKNSTLSFEFQEVIVTTENLEHRLAIKNYSIQTLETKTSAENERKIEKEKLQLEADIKDIDRRIKEVEKTQDESDREAAQKIQEILGVLNSRHENLLELQNTIEKALEVLETHVADFNNLVETANELMNELKMEEEFPELEYSSKANLEKVLDSVKIKDKESVIEIDKEQKEQERLKREVKQHARLLERRRELEAALKARWKYCGFQGTHWPQRISTWGCSVGRVMPDARPLSCSDDGYWQTRNCRRWTEVLSKVRNMC